MTHLRRTVMLKRMGMPKRLMPMQKKLKNNRMKPKTTLRKTRKRQKLVMTMLKKVPRVSQKRMHRLRLRMIRKRTNQKKRQQKTKRMGMRMMRSEKPMKRQHNKMSPTELTKRSKMMLGKERQKEKPRAEQLHDHLKRPGWQVSVPVFV